MSSTAEETSESASKRWLRAAYWASFVVGPIATSLAFLDVAAHLEGPMIGLEGGGAPNALPYLFVAIAFGCITGAIFARSVLVPRPSIPRAIFLGFVMFFGTGIASRPFFHWKWERDCDHGVAKACYAISQISTDPEKHTTLAAKACDLGDPRACPSAAVSASAAPSAAPPAP
jgi:hypothetical protein